MANEISLVTASGRTVTPKDDGIIYEVFSPGNGIIYGGAVTIKDSSTLHITAGHGIVCGRKFTIDDSDIPVSLSGSGSLLGRLYIHLDLADAADPITLLVETGASLTPVVQDADVNINNGVYEINIATFDVDTVTISNLVTLDVTVAPMGDMVGATAGTDGKGGYVPAPQAGDEDKVLRGDGTWGSAGDSATVRYDEATQWIQCKDSLGWFNWRKATRAEWDAIRDHETFTFYVEPGESETSDYTASQSWNNDIMVLTLKSKTVGGGSYTALMIAGNSVGNANTVHIKGNVSHSNTSNSPYIQFREASTKTYNAGTNGTLLQKIDGNGDFEFDASISANTYVAVRGNTSQTTGKDVITINITEMYSYTA